MNKLDESDNISPTKGQASETGVDTRLSNKVPIDSSTRNTTKSRASRYKYLRSQSTVLLQPMTVQPENLEKLGINAEKGGCMASTAIAASSWNAMAGLGMVSMPWAFQ